MCDINYVDLKGGILMNTTSINVLTLLSQGNFSLEEISKYLDIEKNSISKVILSINNFLQHENLPLLEIVEDEICSNLNATEWQYIFTKKNLFTPDDILDYLYVKFIHNGFIILEEEKLILNISRSSIFRYFTQVKNILDKYGSNYSYIPGKGMRLQNISDQNLHIFFKKLAKTFLKNYYFLNQINLVNNLLEKYNSNLLISKLEKVFKDNNISPTNFLISFICALNICIILFEKINLKHSKDYSEFFKLKKSINFHLNKFSFRQQEQIFYFLVNLKNTSTPFEPDSLLKAEQILIKLKENLQIKELDSSLKTILLKKLCYSVFKFDNQILKVKKANLTIHEEKILEIINKSLASLNFNLFFSDKISLMNIIKKIIIEQNKNSIENILILYNEVVISDDFSLSDKFKYYNHSFKFTIEPSFFYKLLPKEYEKNYDLILCDEPFFKKNTQIINNFEYNHILQTINNHIFEKFINKI